MFVFRPASIYTDAMENGEDRGAPLLRAWEGPAILLVDLDAFFASVEQLDHPEWRGKPVIVGGDPDRRGVVSTCSYEARAYGVRSAMPSSTAHKLCPEAIWTHGRFDRYREVSNAVMSVVRDETPHVQQVSIDEAFADVTPTRTNTEHPILVAQRIQARVAELGVTCSIGLGTTKSVAKIASDMDKPRGLTIVFPGTEQQFLADLPVRSVSGIGAQSESKLHAMGIKTLSQLGSADLVELARVFGVNAEMMRDRARGCDVSAVTTEREAKSVSHEVSFATDLETREQIEASLTSLLAQVGRRLRMKGLAGTTLVLKVRFSDRSVHSAQTHLDVPSDDDIELRPRLMELVDKVWVPGRKVRLLGVGVSGFGRMPQGQQTLFDADGLGDAPAARDVLVEDDSKRRSLLEAFDALKDKFGEDAVRFGSAFRTEGNTTGSSSKNPADYR